jgi:hypothetical protein
VLGLSGQEVAGQAGHGLFRCRYSGGSYTRSV